jgi:hypothetical protein
VVVGFINSSRDVAFKAVHRLLFASLIIMYGTCIGIGYLYLVTSFMIGGRDVAFKATRLPLNTGLGQTVLHTQFIFSENATWTQHDGRLAWFVRRNISTLAVATVQTVDTV